MGLDQYIIAEKDGEKEEIGYLRKHNWIHGAMERLWEERERPLPEEWEEEKKEDYRKNGDFNCVPLALSSKDITNLMKDIRANKLKPV